MSVYKYKLPSLWRGNQIKKICYAKNDKIASEILECSVYYIKNYAHKIEVSENCPFTRLALFEKTIFASTDNHSIINFSDLKTDEEILYSDLKLLIEKILCKDNQ